MVIFEHLIVGRECTNVMETNTCLSIRWEFVRLVIDGISVGEGAPWHIVATWGANLRTDVCPRDVSTNHRVITGKSQASVMNAIYENKWEDVVLRVCD